MKVESKKNINPGHIERREINKSEPLFFSFCFFIIVEFIAEK
jgi:hypothetical protein